MMIGYTKNLLDQMKMSKSCDCNGQYLEYDLDINNIDMGLQMNG